MRPLARMAEDVALDVFFENGVKTDQAMLTADPAISAVGDCASFPNPSTGVPTRLESVQNATDHARTVAAQMIGKPVRYGAVPWFWTEQGSRKLQMAGLVYRYDTAVTIGSVDDYSFSLLCFRNGRLIAVESLNRPVDHIAARRLLAGSGSLPSPAEASVAHFDLRSWGAAHK
jgi:3-phenylpropionate/trans-cinnamate dioxygenase ferredoxin reductase subunit